MTKYNFLWAQGPFLALGQLPNPHGVPMRPMIALIVLLSSTTALADETTSSSPSETARTEYRVSLTELLTSSQEAEQAIISKCGEAKVSYRAAEGELSRINTELESSSSEALGDVRANYVTTLEGLKAKEEAKLEQAKSSASQAGSELTEVRAKIEAIEAEIARIDAEIRLEQDARIPSSSYSRRYSLGGGGTAEGLGGLSSTRATAPKPPPLPAEFKSCFPSEVAPGS